MKSKQDRKKSRISERAVAEEFLEAVRESDNIDLKVRLADVMDWSRLIAGDIYCHKQCKRLFMSEYKENHTVCLFCKQSVCPRSARKLTSSQLSYILEIWQHDEKHDLVEDLLRNFNKETQEITFPLYCHSKCFTRNFDDSLPEDRNRIYTLCT